MNSAFHEGELAVQARLGVQAEAGNLGKAMGAIIKPAAREFLTQQQMAIVASIDRQNQVWASLFTGTPGFVNAMDERSVQIATMPSRDPLWQNLQHRPEIGVLVIDLATRRRLRLNGTAELQPNGNLQLQTQQSYFNCPKYIQLRQLETAIELTQRSEPLQKTNRLSTSQERWINQADTFFIASFHPTAGADASHRGGYPGFVQVNNSNHLIFPDYAGNNMFNTLGNLVVNPGAGLLFIDFEQGHTLQLTGTTQIIWEGEPVSSFAGAQRTIDFQIEQVLQTNHATPRRWQFQDYSPANPVQKIH